MAQSLPEKSLELNIRQDQRQQMNANLQGSTRIQYGSVQKAMISAA